MVTLTTNPIPGFFGEYCAVVPKTESASFVAVGITPGQAWANAKIALGLETSQMREGYLIIRIAEEQYGAFSERKRGQAYLSGDDHEWT